jgi:uncharacterized membrane protein
MLCPPNLNYRGIRIAWRHRNAQRDPVPGLTASMSDSTARTFSSDFKRFFLRGLVILLPSVLTLWIVVKAYQFVDGAIAEPINQSVRATMNRVAPYWTPLRNQFDPTDEQVEALIAARAAERRTTSVGAARSELRQANINSWWTARWYMNLIGLIIAIIAVYTAGRLLGGFLGRRVYRYIERIITTVPVFKQVYPYVKQIVDFLFSDEKSIEFNRVVVVEYPRKGIWSVGFQTSSSLQLIQDQAGESVAIFIPSSPTPFTGYTITVPRRDVLELPITVEEAIRFVVSGGVLVPDHQRIASMINGEAGGDGGTPRLVESVQQPALTAPASSAGTAATPEVESTP